MQLKRREKGLGSQKSADTGGGLRPDTAVTHSAVTAPSRALRRWRSGVCRAGPSGGPRGTLSLFSSSWRPLHPLAGAPSSIPKANNSRCCSLPPLSLTMAGLPLPQVFLKDHLVVQESLYLKASSLPTRFSPASIPLAMCHSQATASGGGHWGATGREL